MLYLYPYADGSVMLVRQIAEYLEIPLIYFPSIELFNEFAEEISDIQPSSDIPEVFKKAFGEENG